MVELASTKTHPVFSKSFYINLILRLEGSFLATIRLAVGGKITAASALAERLVATWRGRGSVSEDTRQIRSRNPFFSRFRAQASC
jgi:hypothetical protein